MAIALCGDDFNRLVQILETHPDWVMVRSRVEFLADVFAGSARKNDILAQVELDGSPHITALAVVRRLAAFGQDEPGRESLGVLINKLIATMGGGDDADFIRELLQRYQFETKPTFTHKVERWRASADDDVAEKIIGENTLRHISFLERLVLLSRAVALVRSPWGTGTGFLVSPDLLLTNHHVVRDRTQAEAACFDFNYQLDQNGKVLPVHTARPRSGGIFWTSPMAARNATSDELDATLIELEDAPSDAAPFVVAPARIRRDDRLTIIQHPGGSYKKVSLQNNFVEYADEVVVQYTTTTEPGSSGSPALNDDLVVVALHHGGGNVVEPKTKRRYFRNEGVSIAAILTLLKETAPGVLERLTKK